MKKILLSLLTLLSTMTSPMLFLKKINPTPKNQISIKKIQKRRKSTSYNEINFKLYIQSQKFTSRYKRGLEKLETNNITHQEIINEYHSLYNQINHLCKITQRYSNKTNRNAFNFLKSVDYNTEKTKKTKEDLDKEFNKINKFSKLLSTINLETFADEEISHSSNLEKYLNEEISDKVLSALIINHNLNRAILNDKLKKIEDLSINSLQVFTPICTKNFD